MPPRIDWTRRHFCQAFGAMAIAAPAMAFTESPEARLVALGHDLPPVPQAIGSYRPFTRAAGLLFISGQVPMVEGRLLHPGTVPTKVTIDDARIAARQCALQLLAIARLAAGSLDAVKQVLRLEGFVNSAPDFDRQPQIIDAASDLFFAVFGAAGQHARFAVGASSLPRGACVEIAAVMELHKEFAK